MSVMSVPPPRLPQFRLARSRLALPRSARALGLEFRRNAVPYVLPLLASARHAWLAAHLAALRAGTITLAQLP